MTVQNCPYRGCLGSFGHGSPHLFEQPQIDAFIREGLLKAREAVAAQHIYDTLAAHEAALAAIDALMGGSPK